MKTPKTDACHASMANVPLIEEWKAAKKLWEHSKKMELECNRLSAINAELLAALERFAAAMEQRSYPELQGIACDAFAAIAKATQP